VKATLTCDPLLQLTGAHTLGVLLAAHQVKSGDLGNPRLVAHLKWWRARRTASTEKPGAADEKARDAEQSAETTRPTPPTPASLCSRNTLSYATLTCSLALLPFFLLTPHSGQEAQAL
jgi:hypothetical protein